MDNTKNFVLLEVCFDQLSKINNDLCLHRKLDLAESLQDVMRRLVIFSRTMEIECDDW